MIRNNYLILLGALLCIQHIQAGTAGETTKIDLHKKRYLDRATCFIKRQYTNKENRRLWLAAGILGLASFVSIRFEILQKLLKRESKEKKEGKDSAGCSSEALSAPSGERRGEADVLDNRLDEPDVPEEYRAAVEEEGTTGEDRSNKVRFDEDISHAAPGAYKNRSGTMVRLSKEEEERLAQEAKEEFGEAVKIAAKLRARGVRTIRPEEEEDSGCFIYNPEAPPIPVREVPWPNSLIDPLIEKDNVVNKLKKYKHNATGEAEERRAYAIERMRTELIGQGKRESIVEAMINRAIEQIKQNHQLREAIQQGSWDKIVRLLTLSNSTPRRQLQIKQIFNAIEQKKTLSKSDLTDLSVIFWTLFTTDGACLTPQDRARIEKRTHRDRPVLLEILDELSMPPGPT